jgi:hypothetical protein
MRWSDLADAADGGLFLTVVGKGEQDSHGSGVERHGENAARAARATRRRRRPGVVLRATGTPSVLAPSRCQAKLVGRENDRRLSRRERLPDDDRQVRRVRTADKSRDDIVIMA